MKDVFKIMGAVFSPFILVLIYICLSRSTEIDSTYSDYIFLCISILTGILFIFSIKIKLWIKIVISILGSILYYILLVRISLLTVCYVFGDCL